MGRSRRKYKNSHAKVRVGLPKKNPRVFKPAFTVPDQLVLQQSNNDDENQNLKWDSQGSLIRNYKAFGVVSNPNVLGVRARSSDSLQSHELNLPDVTAVSGQSVDEFEPIDSGSDLETDDLKSALGKRRRDGKKAPLQPLTKMQRVYIGRIIEKHGDDYQAMFRDTTLNSMQHSVATLKKLCQRYRSKSSRLLVSASKY